MIASGHHKKLTWMAFFSGGTHFTSRPMGQAKASVAGYSRYTGLDCSQVRDAHLDAEPLIPRQE